MTATPPRIRPFDYLRSLPEIEADVEAALRRVLRSGHLILGPETEAFEREFAAAVGAKHCVGVASGTAALHAALLAIEVGPGDRVVTVANTCAPTISAIRLAGATPVFADVRDADLQADPAAVASLLDGARAVLPVHLWGRAAPVAPILEAAARRGIPVVEDCAQAQGTRIGGRHAGTLGRMGCFSFYPTKNLGAFGDAGAVVTDDDDLAKRLRLVRMYGYAGSQVSTVEGGNFRIGEMQAAVLRVKLRALPGWMERRRAAAAAYLEALRGAGPSLRVPDAGSVADHAWHQFVVRCADRSAATARLDAARIGWGIHYPVPCHLMPAFRRFGGGEGALPVTERAAAEILSLPIHESVSPADAAEVAGALRAAAAAR
jgi:dTDP-4-amino-4,6-dideoxygalactose transaminase